MGEMWTTKSKTKVQATVANFDDFFKLSNFFYTSVGVRPYDKPGAVDGDGKSLVSSIIFYFGVINMNCMLLCEIIYVVRALATGENILQAIMTMSYIGFVTVGDFKMLFVWRQKAALTKIVQRMVKLFPTDLQLQQEYRLEYYLGQCTRVTVGFSLMYMILIWTYNLFAIMQYLIYDKWLQIRDVGQELPYTMYHVWDWRQNWSFYLLYILQDLAGYTSAAGQISSDLMLCAFATQLIMHYDYVSQSMTNYVIKMTAQDMHFLQDMIHYHEDLLDLSDQLNNIFGLPLFLNFATSSFIICFVGFQMTIGAAPDTLIKLFLFLFSSIAQVYLICHYGQQLIDATLAGYTSATGQIASDIMLCGFCTQLVMHFDYVCQALSNYNVKIARQTSGDREKAVFEDMEYLKDLIRYHECLLTLSQQVNAVFSLPLFLSFAASSFVICFVGFQMTIGVAPDTLIKLFLFLFSSVAQVYLICHYSQLMVNASVNVADAVYNQNWSNADVRYQKMLVLMAERAQKPAQLKATTFVLISRGTMTESVNVADAVYNQNWSNADVRYQKILVLMAERAQKPAQLKATTFVLISRGTMTELMQLSYKFFALLRTMYVKK